MDVVRLACTGANDILAVVALAGYEIGDSEGLAHWNGRTWTWLEKRNSWTLGLDRYQGQWAILDFFGKIDLYDTNSVALSMQTGFTGLNEMYIREAEIFAVGIKGGFLRFSLGTWDRINHSFADNLYSVSGAGNSIYACGANGLILEYDGSICRKIDVNCQCDFTSISCTKDGAVYAVGGQNETGFMVDLISGHVYSLPSRLQFIKSVSSYEIYGVDLDGVVWAWDGIHAKKIANCNGMEAISLSRSDNVLAIGGRNAIAIKDDEIFRVIPVLLDSSFLD